MKFKKWSIYLDLDTRSPKDPIGYGKIVVKQWGTKVPSSIKVKVFDFLTNEYIQERVLIGEIARDPKRKIIVVNAVKF